MWDDTANLRPWVVAWAMRTCWAYVFSVLSEPDIVNSHYQRLKAVSSVEIEVASELWRVLQALHLGGMTGKLKRSCIQYLAYNGCSGANHRKQRA